MMQVEKIKDAGKLVLYFGAQSFMNIFMGWVLGSHVTVKKGTELADGSTLKEDLMGCPAGFALTAMQQMVSFVVFWVYWAVLYMFPQYRFWPKKLSPLIGSLQLLLLDAELPGQLIQLLLVVRGHL